jgi:hypothetical protein
VRGSLDPADPPDFLQTPRPHHCRTRRYRPRSVLGFARFETPTLAYERVNVINRYLQPLAGTVDRQCPTRQVTELLRPDLLKNAHFAGSQVIRYLRREIDRLIVLILLIFTSSERWPSSILAYRQQSKKQKHLPARRLEIAKRGAELYDKFVGFVEDMNSLGNRLKQAQGAFDDANSKLSNGRGNLVGQAQKLRQLGVKPSKLLSPALVDNVFPIFERDWQPLLFHHSRIGDCMRFRPR